MNRWFYDKPAPWGAEVKVDIRGKGNFMKLTRQLQIKVLYSVLMSAAEPIRKSSIERAPSPPTARYAEGRIPLNIRRTRAKGKDINNPEVFVTVKKTRQQKAPKRPTSMQDFPWYWWMVHFGTVKQPPQPFLLEGYLAARNRTLQVFKNGLRTSMKRLAKQYEVEKLGITRI